MNAPETNEEPDRVLALAALGWLLGDNVRASRLLAVTGLTPQDLRARLDDPVVLGAILAFLEAYEPDRQRLLPGATYEEFFPLTNPSEPFEVSVLAVTFDDKSNLFVLDKDSKSIFKFMPDGKQSTFTSGLTHPVDLAIDRSGNLFVSASNGTIFKFTPDGTKTTFFSKMGWPNAMAIDGAGNLFVGDMDNHLILKFTPDGEKSAFVTEINPSDLVCDPLGNLLTPEGESDRIFEYAPDGTKSTFPKGATSPDKQWEYRWPLGKSPGILKAGTTQAVLDLSKDLKVDLPFASEAMVVWAPDSKRFAFNYRAGSRHYTTALFQLRNNKWVPLRSPETHDTSKPLERAMAAQLRELGLPRKPDPRSLSDVTSVRELREWVGPDTAILYCSSAEEVRPKKESGERNKVGADFLLTLKFDAEGNWKIVKTREIPSEPH